MTEGGRKCYPALLCSTLSPPLSLYSTPSRSPLPPSDKTSQGRIKTRKDTADEISVF